MKIGEQILSDGEKVEIHKCPVCGGFHVVDSFFLGSPIIPCPEMKKDKIRIGDMEFGPFGGWNPGD